MKAIIITCLFAAALVAYGEEQKASGDTNLIRTKRGSPYPETGETEYSEGGYGADLVIQVKQVVKGGSSCCCGGGCCGHCCHRNGQDCAEEEPETTAIP